MERGRWIVPLFLLAGVVAPTACVLWFMNVAVNNQRDASRRKLTEAYQGQLALLRARIDSFWEQRATDLAREAEQGPPAAAFRRIVERGLADSVVLLNSDGSTGYPSSPPAAADPVFQRADWTAARALENWGDFAGAAGAYASIVKEEHDASIAARAAQARIRCLLRGGDKTAALRAIREHFTGGRLMSATDLSGRLIAADEQLLAARLSSDPTADQLRRLLADYQNAPMPASQRLFLMQEVGGRFPTLEAERLAARFLESGRASRESDSALQPAGLPDLWRLAAPGGRLIALYRVATIAASVQAQAGKLNVRFSSTPPAGVPPSDGESIAAGPRLPGWQISLSPAGREPFDETVRRQRVAYIWLAILAIAVVTLTALAAAGAFRRHWQIARLKTDLVAAVSHELKTPLASMRLLVDSLLDDEAADKQKTNEYLGLIARENARLSRLIENFLTFARLERDRRRFDFVVTRPEQVIEAAVEAAHERWQAPDCRLDVNISPELPSLRADEDALVTVLLNLLDNAYKYTPGNKCIGLRAFAANGRVVFAVDDNGIGIAAREQKRIFRRFYQVDRRLAREAGGCGLGLSIVELIVTAHGGSVEVKSSPGRGSTFSVVLPAMS